MIVNGKVYNEVKSCLIGELLSVLKLDPTKVVVEVNGEIVPQVDFQVYQLSAEDHIEVVSFVGGG